MSENKVTIKDLKILCSFLGSLNGQKVKRIVKEIMRGDESIINYNPEEINNVGYKIYHNLAEFIEEYKEETK